MTNLNHLYQLCENLGCSALYNEPLYKHTSFKIGGPSDLFINVKDVSSLSQILKYISDNNIPFFIIGNGSNLLVSDAGFRGVVLHLSGDFLNISIENEKNCIIKCGAGVILAKLCFFAMQNSFSGLEFAFGIPGSCGGAAFMNAGAYGYDMSTVIESCEYITPQGELGRLNAKDMTFGYRYSVFFNNKNIITSVTLKLKHGNKEDIKREMDDYMLRRKSKQPLEYPSAGSVFKRPEGAFAGTLIQQCGLKGRKVGDAMVSEKHAGFIINTGRATCDDVLKLIKIIQEKVFSETGFQLKCEVKTLGEV